MNTYTSCFLGIPLPEEYEKAFDQVLQELHDLAPYIETVHPQTPHITIYYLNRQSQYSLEEIKKMLLPFNNILKGQQLNIGSLGYFTEENPKVLFLKVTYEQALLEYRKHITEVLTTYGGLDNNLDFIPHMTVGRIKTKNGQKRYLADRQILTSKLDSIRWDMKIKELVLYGVDSTKSPEFQEKLLTIPLK